MHSRVVGLRLEGIPVHYIYQSVTVIKRFEIKFNVNCYNNNNNDNNNAWY